MLSRSIYSTPRCLFTTKIPQNEDDVRDETGVQRSSSSSSSKSPRPSLPSEELCCKTGCSNCVYLTFADELIDYCKEAGKDVRTELHSMTSDPTLRGLIDMLIREAEMECDNLPPVTKDNDDKDASK